MFVDDCVGELLSLGSIHRAGVSASAAIDALVSVDYVYAVTFRDCFSGAVLSASAAGNAIIRNLVCHGHDLRFRICMHGIAEHTSILLYHK